MLVLLNATGLKRIYWLPILGCQNDGGGVWYVCVRWLGVELTVYSRKMGAEFIRRFNATLAKEPSRAN